MRWIMSRTRKSERRRGHESMRKHVMQRKLLLEVIKKVEQAHHKHKGFYLNQNKHI
jgi:hypothetical protein